MDILSFISRYEAILKERRITKAQFYKDCSVSDAAVSQWRKGKTKPATTTMSRIADYLGVTVGYLLTGEEEKRQTVDDLTLDEEEKKLIEMFKNATPELKAAAMAILRASEEMKQMKAQLGEEAEAVTQSIAQGTAEKFGK